MAHVAIETLGLTKRFGATTALELPGWVTALSPFHHLAAVPMDSVDWSSGMVMLTIGVAAGVAGLIAFERRDLTTT